MKPEAKPPEMETAPPQETQGKTHWAISLAQSGQECLPDFPGKPRLLLACLPRQGLYRTRFGRLWAELDYGDHFERLAALGLFGRNIAREITAFLEPGDCFCDCGAHIGVVSLWVAGHLGAGGQVYSFEPSPPTFQRLQKNVSLSSSSPCRMEILPVAVGSAGGRQDLYVSSQNGWSTLSDTELTLSQKAGATVRQVTSVPVTTLDDFFLGVPGRRLPQALKIDVEGWEEEVLRGAKKFLTQAPPRIIMIEKSAQVLKAMGRTWDSVDQLLGQLGYRPVKEIPPEDVLYRHEKVARRT